MSTELTHELRTTDVLASNLAWSLVEAGYHFECRIDPADGRRIFRLSHTAQRYVSIRWGLVPQQVIVPAAAAEPEPDPADADVNRVWAEFWEPIILQATPEEGEIVRGAGILLTPVQWRQVKRELFDLYTVSQVVPKVYCHATGGRMSKATYNDVRQITGEIDEHYEEQMRETVAEVLRWLPDHVTDDIDQAALAVAMQSGDPEEVIALVLSAVGRHVCVELNIDPKRLQTQGAPA